MPTRHPSLTYLGLADLGDSVRVRVELPDGRTDERELVKDFKADIPDATSEERAAILQRNFEFRGPRSLRFRMDGGIGDFVTALEAILGLKRQLEERGSGEFELIGAFDPLALRFYQRFLDAFPIFDWFSDRQERTPRFPVQALDASPHGPRVDHLAIGSAWDLLWAKWGLPGRYREPDLSGRRALLRPTLAAELARVRAEGRSLPEPGSYVLLCPQARFIGHLKAWPAAHWAELQRRILGETPWRVLIIGDAGPEGPAATDPRVGHYDRHQEPEPNDFVKLLALIAHAAALVSVDTGTAAAAGLLATPCVTLFGPTSPVYFGHPNNANLRISVCPPCMDGPRSRLCTKNVCLFELEPADVFEALLRRFDSRGSPGDSA